MNTFLLNESGLSAKQREEMKNQLDQCDDLNELIQSLLCKKQLRKIAKNLATLLSSGKIDHYK